MAARKPERSARTRRGDKPCTQDTVRWDWTRGPDTTARKVARALWG